MTNLKHIKSGDQVYLTKKRSEKEPLVTTEPVTLVSGRFIEVAGRQFLRDGGACVSGSVKSADRFSISPIISIEEQEAEQLMLRDRYSRALNVLLERDDDVSEFVVERLEALI